MLAFSGEAWTELIVALSIFVPLTLAVVITVVVLRGKKDDPDEQRWRLQEERLRSENAEVVDRVDVGE